MVVVKKKINHIRALAREGEREKVENVKERKERAHRKFQLNQCFAQN